MNLPGGCLESHRNVTLVHWRDNEGSLDGNIDSAGFDLRHLTPIKYLDCTPNSYTEGKQRNGNPATQNTAHDSEVFLSVTIELYMRLPSTRETDKRSSPRPSVEITLDLDLWMMCP